LGWLDIKTASGIRRVLNPEKIYQVSQTQFSIARFYGGINLNGETYTYNPIDDTLTKDKKKGKKTLSAEEQAYEVVKTFQNSAELNLGLDLSDVKPKKAKEGSSGQKEA